MSLQRLACRALLSQGTRWSKPSPAWAFSCRAATSTVNSAGHAPATGRTGRTPPPCGTVSLLWVRERGWGSPPPLVGGLPRVRAPAASLQHRQPVSSARPAPAAACLPVGVLPGPAAAAEAARARRHGVPGTRGRHDDWSRQRRKAGTSRLGHGPSRWPACGGLCRATRARGSGRHTPQLGTQGCADAVLWGRVHPCKGQAAGHTRRLDSRSPSALLGGRLCGGACQGGWGSGRRVLGRPALLGGEGLDEGLDLRHAQLEAQLQLPRAVVRHAVRQLVGRTRCAWGPGVRGSGSSLQGSGVGARLR